MVDILSIFGTAIPQLIISMVPDLWGNIYFVLQKSEFEVFFIIACKQEMHHMIVPYNPIVGTTPVLPVR
jgi:hypothetical protein